VQCNIYFPNLAPHLSLLKQCILERKKSKVEFDTKSYNKDTTEGNLSVLSESLTLEPFLPNPLSLFLIPVAMIASGGPSFPSVGARCKVVLVGESSDIFTILNMIESMTFPSNLNVECVLKAMVVFDILHQFHVGISTAVTRRQGKTYDIEQWPHFQVRRS
jgi:hypothetical protein